MSTLSRRKFLQRGFVGSSAAIFHSLATGIPINWFLNPSQAILNSTSSTTAASKDESSYQPQFLILSTSANGDPMMCNAPGTYLDSNIVHPPSLAAASMQVGGKSYQAATPWTTLPNTMLTRAGFFYFSTRTVVHTEEGDVLKLMGASKSNEMLISSIAEQNQSKLNTIQTAPVSVGTISADESVYFLGKPQPLLNPLGIKEILTSTDNSLSNLTTLRDQTLKQICDYLKRSSNSGQIKILDQYINSRSQARNLSQSILQNLSSITDNSVNSQINAAIILIQLHYTPVVTIHIPFGGDNHADTNLQNEATQTISGVAAMNYLGQQLESAHLTEQVTFSAFNVFGRTMSINHKQYEGRDHNGDAAGGLIIGPNIRGGVIGGVTALPTPSSGNQVDYSCMAIDAQSGQGSLNGNITVNLSLPSFGKTLATAAGVDPASVAEIINSGQPITGALT